MFCNFQEHQDGYRRRCANASFFKTNTWMVCITTADTQCNLLYLTHLRLDVYQLELAQYPVLELLLRLLYSSDELDKIMDRNGGWGRLPGPVV